MATATTADRTQTTPFARWVPTVRIAEYVTVRGRDPDRDLPVRVTEAQAAVDPPRSAPSTRAVLRATSVGVVAVCVSSARRARTAAPAVAAATTSAARADPDRTAATVDESTRARAAAAIRRCFCAPPRRQPPPVPSPGACEAGDPAGVPARRPHSRTSDRRQGGGHPGTAATVGCLAIRPMIA